MRISIEPTTKEQTKAAGKFDSTYPKVIVEYPFDHMDLGNWVDIFRLILLNVGFSEKTSQALEINEEIKNG